VPSIRLITDRTYYFVQNFIDTVDWSAEKRCEKANLSLCLTNYALRHEDVWGSGCIEPGFFTPAIVGGEWSYSRPGRFTPEERPIGTHWIGG
jgi:hypothetical protein